DERDALGVLRAARTARVRRLLADAVREVAVRAEAALHVQENRVTHRALGRCRHARSRLAEIGRRAIEAEVAGRYVAVRKGASGACGEQLDFSADALDAGGRSVTVRQLAAGVVVATLPFGRHAVDDATARPELAP